VRFFWIRHGHHDPRPHIGAVGEAGILRTVLGIIFLTLFALAVIVPFLYMLFTSLKSPSEMGNGRVLPEALVDLVRLRAGHSVLLRVELSDEQLASLNTAPGAPYAPILASPPPRLAEMLLPTVPREALWARRIALEKPSAEARHVIALFELRDPEKKLRRIDRFMLLCPHPSGNAWEAVSATRIPSTATTLLGRLFANYRTLVRWDVITQGQVLEWLSRGYPRWYVNSLFVAAVTVLLGLFFDSLAGFAFAKFEFPLRRPLFGVLLATIMIPYPVTLVPSFFIFAKLGLYNTYAALIIPGLVSAFGIFLVRQYVQTIPDDLIAAARSDGASDFEVYRYIILPAARPVLAALAVFRFLWQWNSYLYPLVLTNRDSMKTLQLGLATLQESFGTVDYGVQMAGATLAVVPILLIYLLMQRHFIAGITMGSVKG
jgi:ABC-type glycerol-3-phosphate transport system permease component